MTRISKSVYVPRPAEEVFDYLADFANTAEWDPGVASAIRTSTGPIGRGSTFHLVTLFRGRRVEVDYEITEYRPSDRVVLVGRNPRFRGIDEIGVSPDGSGSRVDWTVDFQMRGFARVFQPFLGGVFEKLSAEAMEGLEATLTPAAR